MVRYLQHHIYIGFYPITNAKKQELLAILTLNVYQVSYWGKGDSFRVENQYQSISIYSEYLQYHIHRFIILPHNYSQKTGIIRYFDINYIWGLLLGWSR